MTRSQWNSVGFCFLWLELSEKLFFFFFATSWPNKCIEKHLSLFFVDGIHFEMNLWNIVNASVFAYLGCHHSLCRDLQNWIITHAMIYNGKIYRKWCHQKNVKFSQEMLKFVKFLTTVHRRHWLIKLFQISFLESHILWHERSKLNYTYTKIKTRGFYASFVPYYKSKGFKPNWDNVFMFLAWIILDCSFHCSFAKSIKFIRLSKASCRIAS